MDFLKLAVPAWELVLRCAAIYLALLLGFRLFGKREIGQFTLFDLVVVLLVANAVQPAMTGPDSSLTGGLVIIATLLLLNFAVGWVRVRFPAVNRLVEPPPAVVAQDGRWDEDALLRQGITREEAVEALREHGMDDVSKTKEVVLEADGSISVVPKDGGTYRRRRRVRFIRRS